MYRRELLTNQEVSCVAVERGKCAYVRRPVSNCDAADHACHRKATQNNFARAFLCFCFVFRWAREVKAVMRQNVGRIRRRRNPNFIRRTSDAIEVEITLPTPMGQPVVTSVTVVESSLAFLGCKKVFVLLIFR